MFHLKKTKTLALLCAMPLLASAQFNISGTVKDKKSTEPQNRGYHWN